MAKNLKNNDFIFSNGYKINFKYPVKKVVTVNSVIVILLNKPKGIHDNRNVFAFSKSGDFLWQITDVNFFYTGSDDCPYKDIVLDEDNNKIILFNWCSTTITVEPYTGKIIEKTQSQ